MAVVPWGLSKCRFQRIVTNAAHIILLTFNIRIRNLKLR